MDATNHHHNKSAYPQQRIDRSGSLASLGDDLFARRNSLGLDTGDFHRRNSIDSTTAAIDAAILDLTRRRSSLFLGNGSTVGADALEGFGNNSTLPSFGDRRASLNLWEDPALSIAARQQQLQEQQRELEKYQKVLEIQRQQLLSSMQESSNFEGPFLQQRRRSLGGSLGLGITPTGSLFPPPPPRQNNWYICRLCNAKAFASHEESMAHEMTCAGVSRDELLRDASARSAHSQIDRSNRSTVSENQYEPTISQGPFAPLPKPMPLAMPSDKDWLTPLHCFIRMHCVEVFSASEEDVATPSKGKRKPIQVGQVGIRCPFCNHTAKSHERGSTYYPTNISSIYNASMNLLQRHFNSCKNVPEDIMKRYETLKADDARSGTSKKYWIQSALSFGLVDAEHGIRFSALTPPPPPRLTDQQTSTTDKETSEELFSSNSNAVTDHPTSGGRKGDTDDGVTKAEQDMSKSAPLVTPDDEPYSTAFSYHLISQMQPCVFTEADRLGKRKGLPAGFPGLACRHCFGGYGSGRFFPSSIKTLSDTSKTLNVLHNHMMRCRKCPSEIRENLENLRVGHDDERAKMKFGSQKAFFGRIWERLHGKGQPTAFKRPKVEPPAPPSQPFMMPNTTMMPGMGMIPMQGMMPMQGMGMAPNMAQAMMQYGLQQQQQQQQQQTFRPPEQNFDYNQFQAMKRPKHNSPR
ncbi:hypothetical protein FisN_26Lh059 [Fistulifera solaris]|uniref:Uncharacterized protein n=1 Tax=Fistulifera solaris TaxID=1519565 RepID=A0A1Z5KCS1_FISSO|nr:hypothetical protein FisN_26Lh059 [Fistulifera solaris]|eukprot:GAX23996.1 hypothetical protein FisN_26Lh059 [Fistulifera solaris]